MKRIRYVLPVLAVALAISTAARADSFGFAFYAPAVTSGEHQGPAASGSGILNGSLVSPGVYDITTVTNFNITVAGITQSVDPTLPIPTTDPNDNSTPARTHFFFDNLFMPGSNPPVDWDGIVFVLSDGSLFNVYSYQGVLYWNEWVSSLPVTGDPGFVVTNPGTTGQGNPAEVIPEPSSFLLIGTGLFLLAGLFLWKRTPSAVRSF